MGYQHNSVTCMQMVEQQIVRARFLLGQDRSDWAPVECLDGRNNFYMLMRPNNTIYKQYQSKFETQKAPSEDDGSGQLWIELKFNRTKACELSSDLQYVSIMNANYSMRLPYKSGLFA